MRWEELLLRELDDLELQAEGLYLADRAAAVSELSLSTYAEVELSARLHASVGSPLQLFLRGGGTVDGTLARAGQGWVLLQAAAGEVVVVVAAILRVRGAVERAVPAEARCLTSRLGLGSALRQLAESREQVAVTLVDGAVVRGRIRRVGLDFAEVVTDAGAAELLPFDALAVLRRAV